MSNQPEPSTLDKLRAISTLDKDELAKLASCDAVNHIWADFRWKMKIRDYTPAEVVGLIDLAISDCHEKVKEPTICAMAVDKLKAMRQTALEHLGVLPIEPETENQEPKKGTNEDDGSLPLS